MSSLFFVNRSVIVQSRPDSKNGKSNEFKIFVPSKVAEPLSFQFSEKTTPGLKRDIQKLLSSVSPVKITHRYFFLMKSLGILVPREKLQKSVNFRGVLRAPYGSPTNYRRQFQTSGKVLIPDIFPKKNCESLSRYYDRKNKEGYFYNLHEKERKFIFDDAVSQRLLKLLLPFVSSVCGLKMKPVSAHTVLYRPGKKLKQHKDHVSWEVTLSLQIKRDAEHDSFRPWPMHIAAKPRSKNFVKITTSIGDAILFRGSKLPHFRQTLPRGNRSSVICFHFKR